MSERFEAWLGERLRVEGERDRRLRCGTSAYAQSGCARALVEIRRSVASAARALASALRERASSLEASQSSWRASEEASLHEEQSRQESAVAALRASEEARQADALAVAERDLTDRQRRLGELMNSLRERGAEVERLRRDVSAVDVRRGEELQRQSATLAERLASVRHQYAELIESECASLSRATEQYQRQGLEERNAYERTAREGLEKWRADALERRSARVREREAHWRGEHGRQARQRVERLASAEAHRESSVSSATSESGASVSSASTEVARLESALNQEHRHLIADLQARRREAIASATATQRVRLEVLRSRLSEMEKELRERQSFARSAGSEILKLRSVVPQLPAFAKREVKRRIDEACEIMDLKGNIRVYCRVRPTLAVERESGKAQNCVSFPVEGDVSRDEASNPEHYEFDAVFAPETTQEAVFYEVLPYIQKLLDGYNICIFAYGQTSSGKTYTMEGPEDNPGVNNRSLYTLFEMARERQSEIQYQFTLSILEIYNERVYDLLAERPVAYLPNDSSGDEEGEENEGMKLLRRLKIRTDKSGTPFVEGLETVPIRSYEQAREYLSQGRSKRFEAAHSLNEHSSRSHLVVTVTIAGRHRKTKERYIGSLNLIDLAGSERVTKTEATGQRLEEAKSINRSLSALGNVIKCLGERKSCHVPYRDSKLTYLLSSSLGGQSKVLMFVNVSPALYNIPETISSLQFASRCRRTDVGIAVRNKLKSLGERSVVSGLRSLA